MEMPYQQLFNWTLRVTYLYGLLTGLFPAPLDWAKLKLPTTSQLKKNIYAMYSVLVHILTMAVLALTLYYTYRKSYMPGETVLKWTYTVSNATKIVAITLLIKEIWLKRPLLLEAFQQYTNFLRRHRAFQHSLVATCNDRHRRTTQRIQLYWICKFFTAIANVLLIASNFLIMHRIRASSHLWITILNFILSTFLLTAMAEFFFALCQLYRQFEFVNIELIDLLRQLKQLARHNFYSTNSEDAKKIVYLHAQRLAALSAMHFDCYRLTLQVFRICETPSAAIMLRLFVTNVRIVYNVVQFVNRSGSMTDSLTWWSAIIEFLVMVFFYWDVALLLGVIDGVLTACNETGQLLRKCSELLELRDFRCLQCAVDQFADQLRCHKLKYKVCGLFEFNKEASLRYFLTVLVQVSVLVQFDLKNNLQ